MCGSLWIFVDLLLLLFEGILCIGWRFCVLGVCCASFCVLGTVVVGTLRLPVGVYGCFGLWMLFAILWVLEVVLRLLLVALDVDLFLLLWSSVVGLLLCLLFFGDFFFSFCFCVVLCILR